MNEREILLAKIASYKFAVTDIRLFLDTHPGDQEMIRELNEYENLLRPLVTEYEGRYGPLTLSMAGERNTWTWVRNPWPWDTQEED